MAGPSSHVQCVHPSVLPGSRLVSSWVLPATSSYLLTGSFFFMQPKRLAVRCLESLHFVHLRKRSFRTIGPAQPGWPQLALAQPLATARAPTRPSLRSDRPPGWGTKPAPLSGARLLKRCCTGSMSVGAKLCRAKGPL